VRISRRIFLAGSALLVVSRSPLLASAVIDIRMQGRSDGSEVWFDPIGLHIELGQSIRWTNGDPGNSHTTTAYHPSILARSLRIPGKAEPWNSDYLLPDQSYSITFSVPGVYDYYCQPHEHAGMLGRIVVGRAPDTSPSTNVDQDLPKAALDAFPSVAEIIAKGVVRRA
jgi:plastocyanin